MTDTNTPKIRRRPGIDPVKDHMNRCKHFTGVMNDKCDAGVAYADVSIDGEFKYRYGPTSTVYTVGRRWPCRRDDAEAFGVPACPHAEWPTLAEAEADKAETDEMIARTIGARNAIVAHINDGGGDRGTVECPVCKGVLRYIRSSYNGHIHAKCETDGCCAWME